MCIFGRHQKVDEQEFLLQLLCPDWREITGMPWNRTPFREWLRTKEIAYQLKIHSSKDALTIAESIRAFRTETGGAVK